MMYEHLFEQFIEAINGLRILFTEIYIYITKKVLKYVSAKTGTLKHLKHLNV